MLKTLETAIKSLLHFAISLWERVYASLPGWILTWAEGFLAAWACATVVSLGRVRNADEAWPNKLIKL